MMRLFNRAKSITSGEQPLYQSNRGGFYVRVYKNRIDFKDGIVNQSVPINQIANVKLGIIGQMSITLETAGGQKFTLVAPKKKELREAIYSAMEANKDSASMTTTLSSTDELTKLAALKEKGILTQQEFDVKKRQLLGL